jgi:octaheme c-type cytochrome (tetrathionate reductase family)
MTFTRSKFLWPAFLGCLLMAGSALGMIEEHQAITGPFTSGPEVTAVCLECHQDVADAFMHTSHWTWTAEQAVDGQPAAPYGKANALNNFCISLGSNWPRCTSCHAGYGWQDGTFDFSNAGQIDCLVCHDLSGQYKKFPTGAGHPITEAKDWKGKPFPVSDLVAAAQSVGTPERRNCGVCHFYGGGGDGVKHGDLDSSMLQPALTLDVHMSADGQDFACQQCHVTESHDIKGNAMSVSPAGGNHISCEDCHDAEPHQKASLNRHSKTVACQTCHIPTFSRELPTKMNWDWSVAGQDRKPVKDAYGKPDYAKIKGEFVWGKDVTPEYAWFNGQYGVMAADAKVDPAGVNNLNWPLGEMNDHGAKIYPFKVHRGKQIYDTGNGYFGRPKLFGKGGYWKTFDWNAAMELGMKTAGMDYSGSYDFAATAMYWRINHQVAPASEALKCTACHGKKGDRMDWAALGYDGDPRKKSVPKRFPKSAE